MKAIVVERYTDPKELRVSEVSEPLPREGQVCIDVRAAGVNFFDTLIVRGKYQEQPPFPFSPGGEVAGVVRDAPVGSSLSPGDRVMARVGHGGFAGVALADVSAVYRLPPSMSFEEAAAFPIVYGTAHVAVVNRGAAQPGETVLVTAAAGGVGLAAVQVGKARSCRVIALAGGDKLDAVRAAGADLALDYRAPGWVDAVRAATDGRGVDVVVENVGGDVFEGCMKCVAWGGRLVVVGFSSGEIPQVKLNRVLLKHIALVGVHFGPMMRHEPRAVMEGFRELFSLYAQGKIRPIVSRVLPLERAAEALSLLSSRSTVGKIVLVP